MTTRSQVLLLISALVAGSLAAESAQASTEPRDLFFDRLVALCGETFEGRSSFPEDGPFAGEPLVAHVATCTESEVRIPFAVGADRSRTWVLTRGDGGLLLKHDHRHADGTPDEITNYGGWASAAGGELSQSFAADDETKRLIPEASTNVWTLSLDPDEGSLTYYLERHAKPRFKATLQRVEGPGSRHPASADPASVDADFPPSMRELSIASGGSRLNGLVYLAGGAGPHPTVVMLHGYPGNERNLDLAQAIRRAGMNALFFNYRGSWASGGEFSFAASIDDAAAAVDYLRSDAAADLRGDPDRVALIGHSFGGFVGAVAAAEDPTIDCLAFLAGANFGPYGVEAGKSTEVEEALVAAFGAAMDPASGPIRAQPRRVVRQMIERAQVFDINRRAEALADRPLLVVAGERDTVLAKAQHHDPFVAALTAAGAKRMTEVVYDDDHAFSAHRVRLARRLVDWLRRDCWPP